MKDRKTLREPHGAAFVCVHDWLTVWMLCVCVCDGRVYACGRKRENFSLSLFSNTIDIEFPIKCMTRMREEKNEEEKKKQIKMGKRHVKLWKEIVEDDNVEENDHDHDDGEKNNKNVLWNVYSLATVRCAMQVLFQFIHFSSRSLINVWILSVNGWKMKMSFRTAQLFNVAWRSNEGASTRRYHSAQCTVHDARCTVQFDPIINNFIWFFFSSAVSSHFACSLPMNIGIMMAIFLFSSYIFRCVLRHAILKWNAESMRSAK